MSSKEESKNNVRKETFASKLSEVAALGFLALVGVNVFSSFIKKL
jgi:hypothetical protein